MAGQNGYVNKKIAKEVFDRFLIEKFFIEKANFDWDYREFNDHISLRSYKGLDKEIIVPEEIDGKSVRILYKNAIIQSDIEKIVIPKTVYVDGNSYPNVRSECVIERV